MMMTKEDGGFYLLNPAKASKKLLQLLAPTVMRNLHNNGKLPADRPNLMDSADILFRDSFVICAPTSKVPLCKTTLPYGEFL